MNELDFPDKYYVIWSEEEVYDENADEVNLLNKMLIADYVLTFGDHEDYEKLVLEHGDRPFMCLRKMSF